MLPATHRGLSGVEYSSAALRAMAMAARFSSRDPVAEAVLGQDRGEGPEGVGLHHVAAHLVERPVDLVHGVGPGHHQQFVAPLELGAAEVLGGQLLQLQVGPHGAVEHDHALARGLEVARFECAAAAIALQR